MNGVGFGDSSCKSVPKIMANYPSRFVYATYLPLCWVHWGVCNTTKSDIFPFLLEFHFYLRYYNHLYQIIHLYCLVNINMFFLVMKTKSKFLLQFHLFWYLFLFLNILILQVAYVLYIREALLYITYCALIFLVLKTDWYFLNCLFRLQNIWERSTTRFSLLQRKVWTRLRKQFTTWKATMSSPFEEL